MTHWRMGSKRSHSGCEILPDGKDICVEIDRIEFVKEHEINGVKTDNKFIMYFKPNQFTNLPMVLNATNSKRLSHMFSTDDIDDIKNEPIILTREKTKMKGEEMWGLRISNIPAKTMVMNHPNWNACVNHIAKGGSIEQIKAKYTMSNIVEKELIKQAEEQKNG